MFEYVKRMVLARISHVCILGECLLFEVYLYLVLCNLGGLTPVRHQPYSFITCIYVII